MANEEMTLLQFVALTLPAAAILLQSLLNYQERYLDKLNVGSFETEFQLLEWGFLFLIFSGVIFSIEIVKSLTSWISLPHRIVSEETAP